MNHIKFIMIFIVFSCTICILQPSDKKVSISEFGYDGKYWDFVKISMKVKLCKKDYFFEFSAFHSSKKRISCSGPVSCESVKEFWNFIIKNDILNLRPASLTDPNIKDEDFDYLYGKKGIDHQSAIIYDFYFIYNEKKISVKIDDLKNVSDKRYFMLLKKINCFAKQPSFKTVFEYNKHLNDVAEQKIKSSEKPDKKN